MFLVLVAFGFGVVVWFMFPGLPGRVMNLLLVGGLVVLALFSGLFSTPQMVRDVGQLPTGEEPGTLAQKQQSALTLAQQRDALKEKILASRSGDAALRMMDAYSNLSDKTRAAEYGYEQDRYSAPKF